MRSWSLCNFQEFCGNRVEARGVDQLQRDIQFDKRRRERGQISKDEINFHSSSIMPSPLLCGQCKDGKHTVLRLLAGMVECGVVRESQIGSKPQQCSQDSIFLELKRMLDPKRTGHTLYAVVYA
ncbi:MAG: hypothetical protein DHS20C16_31400 [Phycisphaerae bacterium]|nr:MAG: hypothetical protein DHS20C16_31400 [Phycisphaerae bacterium]